jgi:hypothetical protein
VVFGLFLVLCSVVSVLLSSTPSWAAATLDDLSKDVTSIKVELAGLKSDMGALKDDFGNLRGIVVGLFCAVAGMLAGLFYFVFNISVSLRVPKEERVLKLEGFMGKMANWIPQVNEKLHLPKMAL